MATQKLSGNDFIVKGDFQLLDDGTLFLDRASEQDYNIALVSKEVFSFNHNKSVVFIFRADPFTEKYREPTIYFDDINMAFINDSNKLFINEEQIGSFPDFKKLKGSKNYVGVLDKDNLLIYSITDGSKIYEANGVDEFDVGDDCYGYIIDGKVVVNAKEDNNPVLNTPEIENPIKVAFGESVGAALLNNGNVVVWGNTDFKPDGQFQDVQIAKNLIGLLDVDNTLKIVDLTSGDIVSIQDNIAFFSLNDKGEIAFVRIDGTSNIVDGYPVEVHKYDDKYIAFMRDGEIITNIQTEEKLKAYYCHQLISEDFAFYPQLQDNRAFNVLFAIQRNDLPSDTPIYFNPSGEATPIIRAKENKSAFSYLSKNTKGFIISKFSKGKDFFFNVKGEDNAPFYVNGGETLPSQLVDFGKNLYKVAISFTPFGKVLRVFKEIDGEFIEIKAKYLSLEENPFANGRLAIYIKSASSFHLISVEVTDELDTSLLPEEIIYRDIDTDILQTKVAESLNKHTKAITKIMSAVEKQASTLQKVVNQIKDKFADLEERISNLEG